MTRELVQTARQRTNEPVKQFSVFISNHPGRLHDLTAMLGGEGVHVLALTVLDTTDSAIIRFVSDDPDRTREVLLRHSFPFTESALVVVELNEAADLHKLMAALLEAELNVNYLYSFIPHPHGKSLLALSLEDREIAEQALRRHQFSVLRQSDISR